MNQNVEGNFPNAVTSPDYISIDIDQPIEIDILTNDQGIRSLKHVNSATNGTVQVIGGSLVKYTPNSGFEGDDSFKYTVTAKDGSLKEGTVFIYVGYCSGSKLTNTPFANSGEVDGSSENNAFTICTAEQFLALSSQDYTNLLYLKLNKNLDLISYDFNSYTLVGPTAQKLKINLLGNGKTISNLNLSSAGNDYLGLFSELDVSSKINDLTLKDFNFSTGTSNYVGAVAGKATETDLININIDSITINAGGSYVGGAFGYYSGYSEDLQITGAINSTGNYVGGLAGYYIGTCNNNKSVTVRLESNVNVTGNDWVGGSAGFLKGTGCGVSLREIYTNGTVIGHDFVGGLAGETQNTRILNKVLVSNTVSGNDYTGGVFGKSLGNTSVVIVSETQAFGNVTGNNYVGGFAGEFEGPIERSFAQGNVQGANYVGGLIGHLKNGIVNYIYANGNVTATTSFAGGLIGLVTAGTLKNDYASGIISSPGTKGGLIGQHEGTAITNCFYDSQVGTVANMCGAGAGSGCNNTYGKTTAQMNTITTYNSYFGWDFLNGSDGPNDIWKMGVQYPELYFVNPSPNEVPIFSGGDGSESNPFLISNLSELNQIGYNPRLMDKFFKVSQDFSVSGVILQIGESDFPFIGVFDGNNKTLSDMNINQVGTDNLGLFKATKSPSIIKNLTLSNVDITGRDYVGALGSNLTTTLSNIQVSGNVSGRDYVGLVSGYASLISNTTDVSSSGTVTGQNYIGGAFGFASGSLENSSSSATVNGNDRVGGLYGADSFLHGLECRNCSAAGNVSGRDYVGGLVGYADDLVFKSHASGTVNGRHEVGGLVGTLYSGSGRAYNSYATGNVTGTGNLVGGLVGYAEWHAKIKSSFATGNVSGINHVGGVSGQSSGPIQESYALGNVTGSNNIGGVVGYLNPLSSDIGDVEGLFSRGNVTGKTGVTGDQHIGGLFGVISWSSIIYKVKHNYYSGVLTPGTASGNVYVGGVAGNYLAGIIEGLYWNTTIAGGLNDYGRSSTNVDDPEVFAETTANMTSATGQIYIDESWDFTDVWRLDTNNENGGFPIPIQPEYPY